MDGYARVPPTLGYKSIDDKEKQTYVPEVTFFYEMDCPKCKYVYEYILEPLDRELCVKLNMVNVEHDKCKEYDIWKMNYSTEDGGGTPYVAIIDDPRSYNRCYVYALDKSIRGFDNKLKSMRDTLYKDLHEEFGVENINWAYRSSPSIPEFGAKQ